MVGALDLLGGTYEMDLLDILLAWCLVLGGCLVHCSVVFDLDTDKSPAGDLFAGDTICRVRSWMSAWYSSCLVVWIPLFLDPPDGVFGRFDLAALCNCRTFNFRLFVLLWRYS